MKELANCNSILIDINNTDYAFDFINYEILKLDNNQKFIFNSLLKNKKFPNEKKYKKDILKILLKIKAGLFFTENIINLYKKNNEKYSNIISFPIVHRCNLKCKYCFAKSGETYKGKNKEFKRETIRYIFDFLENILNSEMSDIRLEFVSGGETFLNKNLYKDIMTYTKDVAESKSLNMKVFTLTNGTTMDEDILQYVFDNNIFLGISIDGPKDIHNFHRPFHNNKNSYDVVINNINKLFENKSSIWIVSVITSYTKSLIDILNHNKSLGSKSMEMRIMRGKDEYGLAMTNKNVEYFKNLYFEFTQYLKENIDDIMLILNDYDTFGKIIKRLLVKEKVIYRCQAGKSKFSFTAEGDVYPCDSFVGNNEYLIGNVFTKEVNRNVLNTFLDMNVYNIFPCNKCDFKFLCGGDCYYNSYINHNDFIYCNLQKYLCKLAIDLIYYIQEKDYKAYIKLQNFSKVRYLFN